jgi:hypothetical protein
LKLYAALEAPLSTAWLGSVLISGKVKIKVKRSGQGLAKGVSAPHEQFDTG